MPDPRINPKRSRALLNRYLEALVCGDQAAGSGVLREAVSDGWSLAQIYSHIIAPVHTNGDRSKGRRIAMQISLSHMDELRSRLPVHENNRGSVVVAVPGSGESNLVSAMMSDVFRSDGWTVDVIGGRFEMKALLRLIQERRADLLAIPFMSGLGWQRVKTMAQRVRSLPDPPMMIVCGAPWGKETVEELESEGVRIAMDFEAAVRIGREGLAAKRGEGGLVDFLQNLGGRIRARRRELSFTQQQLAEKANLDRTYIIAVERGRQNVTVGAVMRIAEALEISIGQLFFSAKTNAGELTGSIESWSREHR